MKKPLLLLAALAALAATACGSVTPYAARVNGGRISQQDLNVELEAIKANKTYGQAIEQQLSQGGEHVTGTGQGTFDAGFVARVLTRQIFLQLVHEGLTKRHITVTAKELADARQQQQSQFEQQFGSATVFTAFPKVYQDALARRAAEVSALQNALSKTKIDDVTIKAYYDSHLTQFSQTCVRHILAAFPADPATGQPGTPPPDVDAQKKAQAAEWKARLDKGEDFATVAKESGDPGSAAKGGDLGCQAPGTFVPEFSDAMDKLQPNQISDPVRSSFGYHIIQVLSRKQQTLDEAKAAIQQTLQSQDQNVVQDFLQKALDAAKVTVNPRYGHFSKGDPKTGTQPGVQPPTPPSTTSTSTAGGGTPSTSLSNTPPSSTP